MKSLINVKVPYNVVLPYTLYVQGMNINKPVSDEDGEYYFFTYPSETVFVLFYTFEKFRRCCIVTGWNKELGTEPVRLPGVDSDLSLLYETRGRKLDELKRILFIFNKQEAFEIYRFNYLFWFRLVALVERSGGKKWEIEKLYREHKKEYENEK